MRYFTVLLHSYTPTNKLTEAVSVYLKKCDRIIMDNEKALNSFKESVLLQIDNLNSEHPRCKAIRPSWWCSNKEKNTITLSLRYGGVGCCALVEFRIYQAIN